MLTVLSVNDAPEGILTALYVNESPSESVADKAILLKVHFRLHCELQLLQGQVPG